MLREGSVGCVCAILSWSTVALGREPHVRPSPEPDSAPTIPAEAEAPTSEAAVPAAAEVTQSSARSDVETPPDVVRFKNGGMVRGTINELIPGEFVEIRLSSGETRRIPMAQVRYAGAKEDEPRTRPRSESRLPHRPAPRPEGDPKVKVELLAEDDVRFHVLYGQSVGEFSGTSVFGSTGVRVSGTVQSDSYRELCAAPCKTTIEPGWHTFALSVPPGKPIKVEDPLEVHDGSVLAGQYVSYSALRTAGWITIVTSGIVGAAVMLTSGNDCDVDARDCGPIDLTQVLGGAGIAGAGALVGILMIGKRDEATIESARLDPIPHGSRALVRVRGAF